MMESVSLKFIEACLQSTEKNAKPHKVNVYC